MAFAISCAQSLAAEPTQPPSTTTAVASTNAAPVYVEYEVEKLVPIVNKALNGGRNFDQGRALFSSLSCSKCHSFGEGEDGKGGVGPDLTGLGGRYGVLDILESIIIPSKEISNLFGSWVLTTKDGDDFSGKIIYENDDEVALAENIFDLSKTTKFNRSRIQSIEESKVSLMPPGLINTATEPQIADLIAFLISGGDPANRMFRPLPSAASTNAPATSKPSTSGQ